MELIISHVIKTTFDFACGVDYNSLRVVETSFFKTIQPPWLRMNHLPCVKTSLIAGWIKPQRYEGFGFM